MDLIIIIIVCCCCISISGSGLYFFSQSSSLSPTMTTEPSTMNTKPPIVIPTPTISNLEKKKKSDDLIIELKTKVGSNINLVKDIINEINSLGIYQIHVIPEGSMVTMDVRMDRFRVFVSEFDVINGVKPG
jgi:hypothetical protein